MNIQVRTRGRITLTGLENGVILLRTQTSKVDRLANKLANDLSKAGITLPDLLDELRQLRK